MLLIGMVAIAGCQPPEYFSKSSYFDGAVIVEYKQSRMRGTNDYLTFRFYEKGNYDISFSTTHRGGCFGENRIPQNFTKTIEVPPREIVVEQYILPNFLQITITRNGKSESHDFS